MTRNQDFEGLVSGMKVGDIVDVRDERQGEIFQMVVHEVNEEGVSLRFTGDVSTRPANAEPLVFDKDSGFTHDGLGLRIEPAVGAGAA